MNGTRQRVHEGRNLTSVVASEEGKFDNKGRNAGREERGEGGGVGESLIQNTMIRKKS